MDIFGFIFVLLCILFASKIILDDWAFGRIDENPIYETLLKENKLELEIVSSGRDLSPCEIVWLLTGEGIRIRKYSFFMRRILKKLYKKKINKEYLKIISKFPIKKIKY